jgi:cytochrome P450
LLLSLLLPLLLSLLLLLLLLQVVERHGEAITLAALEAMPYADAVIRETLRVAPPSAAVFRRALVDLEVSGGCRV